MKLWEIWDLIGCLWRSNFTKHKKPDCVFLFESLWIVWFDKNVRWTSDGRPETNKQISFRPKTEILSEIQPAKKPVCAFQQFIFSLYYFSNLHFFFFVFSSCDWIHQENQGHKDHREEEGDFWMWGFWAKHSGDVDEGWSGAGHVWGKVCQCLLTLCYSS